MTRYCTMMIPIAVTFFAGMMGIGFAQEIKAVPDETAETFAERFVPLAEFAPTLWPIYSGDQNCAAKYVETEGESLVLDFSFAGHGGIEYLAFGTPIAVRQSELYLGIRVKVEAEDGTPLPCPFSPRFIECSGEVHQRPLNIRIGDWRIGKISENGLSWGGGESADGVLQFPCFLDCVTMDRIRDGWKQKGRLTLEEIRFFTAREIDNMITLTQENAANETNNGTYSEANNESNHKTNIFPVDGVPKPLVLKIAKNEKYADLSLRYFLRRQTNGILFPETEITPDAEGRVTLERVGVTGFESFVVAPCLIDENGDKTLGRPQKISLAVAEGKAALNRRCCVSTHVNLHCVDRVAEAGIGMIRDDIVWNQIEKEKGVYVFPEHWDIYVNRVRELGLEPLLIIVYSNPLYDGGDFPHSDEAIAAYARYAAEVVKHFKGRCTKYEIWNEWTGGCGMADWPKKSGSNTPENYVKLLAAASKAIRAVDPDAYLIGGGGDHPRGHFAAIEKMMTLGVMNYCDAFSVHPYVYPASPENADMRGMLQRVIDTMRQNGCEHPKLWLTELGWPTYRGLTKEEHIDGSSLKLERFSASMLTRCALDCLAMPEVENFTWYDLENDGTNLEYNEHNFGLLQNSAFGNPPKASWSAYRALTERTLDATVRIDSERSTDNRRIVIIERPNAATILAAWTLEGEEMFSLDGVKSVHGLFGEELPLDTRTLSPLPTYFEME